jgi:hypothetical protein
MFGLIQDSHFVGTGSLQKTATSDNTRFEEICSVKLELSTIKSPVATT